MLQLIKKINQNITIENDCHLWQKGLNTDGYAKTYFNNKTIAVHRFIYFYNNPNKNKAKAVHHICGNRNCINLQHLQLISHNQNLAESLRVKELKSLLKEKESIITNLNLEIKSLRKEVK